MIPSSLYIIKSSVLLSVFLLYYVFILKKQTFFTYNRVYLLSTMIVSVCTPLFHFSLTIDYPTTEHLPTLYYISGFMEEVFISGREIPTHSPFNYLIWIYISGICFFTFRYFRGVYHICKLIHSHKCKRVHKLKIIPISSNYSTFSFFNYIFINTAFLKHPETKSVLEHERIHIRQGHSSDLLIAGIICILYWFNPLVWIYRKNIAQNHEYIADRQVVMKYQTGRYLQQLVNQVLKGNVFSFTNCFSCSNLKKRMIMMTKKQSNKFSMLNYIPALFIGGILCTAFTCIATETPERPSISEEKSVITEEILLSDSTMIFQLVEIMPQFNGDLHAWLKENLKYPEEARKAKKQGRTLVNFVINEDGSVSDVKIQRSSGSKALDEEALRAAKAMPAWIPGKQRGKTVKVSYSLPFNFKL